MKLGMGNCVGLARLTSNLAGNWGHPEKKKDRLKGGRVAWSRDPKIGAYLVPQERLARSEIGQEDWVRLGKQNGRI